MNLIWRLRGFDMDFDHYRMTLNLVARACVLSAPFSTAVAANSAEVWIFDRYLTYRPKAYPVIANGTDTERSRSDVQRRAEVGLLLGIVWHPPGPAMVGHVDPKKRTKTVFPRTQPLARMSRVYRRQKH